MWRFTWMLQARGPEKRRFSRRRLSLAVGCVVGTLLPLVGTALALSPDDFENEIINYRKAQANDPVARLQQQIDRGEVKLEYDSKHGYLISVLKQLKVPVSSQMLVFSKTSFQRDLISPQSPRALYFN